MPEDYPIDENPLEESSSDKNCNYCDEPFTSEIPLRRRFPRFTPCKVKLMFLSAVVLIITTIAAWLFNPNHFIDFLFEILSEELSNANIVAQIFSLLPALLLVDFGLFTLLIIRRYFFTRDLMPPYILWLNLLSMVFTFCVSVWLIFMLPVPFILFPIGIMLVVLLQFAIWQWWRKHNETDLFPLRWPVLPLWLAYFAKIWFILTWILALLWQDWFVIFWMYWFLTPLIIGILMWIWGLFCKCKVEINGKDCLCANSRWYFDYIGNGEPKGGKCEWEPSTDLVISPWAKFPCFAAVRSNTDKNTAKLKLKYTYNGITCETTKVIKIIKIKDIKGPKYLCIKKKADFEAITNHPGCGDSIEWRGGTNIGARGKKYRTGFNKPGPQQIEVTCRDNANGKAVKQVNVIEIVITKSAPTVYEGGVITLTATPSIPGGKFTWTTPSARITLNAPIDKNTVVVRGISKSIPGASEPVEVSYTIGGVTCKETIGLTVSVAPCDVNELRDEIRTLVTLWAGKEGDVINKREFRGKRAGDTFIQFLDGKKAGLQSGAATAQALLWVFSGLTLPVTQIVLGLAVQVMIDKTAINTKAKKILFIQLMEANAKKSNKKLDEKVKEFIGAGGELEKAGKDCKKLEALLDRMKNLPQSQAMGENEIYRYLLLKFAKDNDLSVYLKHHDVWNKGYSKGYYSSTDWQIPGGWDGRDIIEELNGLPPPYKK
jgi:hypothetical protein